MGGGWGLCVNEVKIFNPLLTLTRVDMLAGLFSHGKKIVFLIYKQHIFLTKDLYAESVYQCMACKQLRRCEMLTAARGVCSNKSDLIAN